MKRALVVLNLAAFIDAAGIGLIIPILPTILRHLAGVPGTIHYGVLIASFALMQFLAAPVLGRLSDRFGRRPVMLLSLAGGALDYLLAGFAPRLWVLYLARMIGGATAANLSVISATIADLVPAGQRVRHYGLMNAALGAGWIAGPVLGGTLGQVSPSLPFVVAAALNGANLLLAALALPETRAPQPRAPLRLRELNAFASLRWLGSLRALAPLLAIYGTLCLLDQIPGSLWVLYGQARYDWSPSMIGWSLAGFGLLFALAQALLSGPLTARLGAIGCLRLGMVSDGLGTLLVGLSARGWMAFASIPLLAGGSVGLPALQGRLSAGVSSERQGELQGTLTSLANLGAVFGPILATLLFAATRQGAPGAVWVAGGLGYLACMMATFR